MIRNRRAKVRSATRHEGVAAVGFTIDGDFLTRRDGTTTGVLRTHRDGFWHVRTPNRDAADLLVGHYGGTVEPWHREGGWWIAHTETAVLDGWLPWSPTPPDLDETEAVQSRVDSVLVGPLYRLWDPKSRRYVRDCDLVTNIPWVEIGGRKTQGRPEACLCEKQRPAGIPTAADYADYTDTDLETDLDPYSEAWRECKPTTTVKFTFPFDAPGSHWTVVTKAAGAAMRWPTQIETIAVNQPTVAEAQVRIVLTPRSNKTHEWVDIDFLSAYSNVEIAAGAPRRAVAILAAGSGPAPVAALTAGPATVPPHGDLPFQTPADDHDLDLGSTAAASGARSVAAPDDDDDGVVEAVLVEPASPAEFKTLCETAGADPRTVGATVRAWLDAPVDWSYSQLCEEWPMEMAAVAAVLEAGDPVTVENLRSFMDSVA